MIVLYKILAICTDIMIPSYKHKRVFLPAAFPWYSKSGLNVSNLKSHHTFYIVLHWNTSLNVILRWCHMGAMATPITGNWMVCSVSCRRTPHDSYSLGYHYPSLLIVNRIVKLMTWWPRDHKHPELFGFCKVKLLGGSLDKAYDVTIPRFRKSQRNIIVGKMHILRCMV